MLQETLVTTRYYFQWSSWFVVPFRAKKGVSGRDGPYYHDILEEYIWENEDITII